MCRYRVRVRVRVRNLSLMILRVRVSVRVRCFVVTGDTSGCCVYSNIAEEGGRGSASGLWLEGRLCSMLTVMLGGDLDVATRV